MTLETLETLGQEAQPIQEPEQGQRISREGRIIVSRRAWFARVVTLSGLIFIMLYNLSTGLALGDPLVTYSTLMPFHTFLVFSIGWLFFRSKANGSPLNELVSVIIPVYNQEFMIEAVVDAVYRSTYKNIEVIVVNDGSKDDTKEVLDYLSFKYAGLKVINKKNGGKRTAVAAGFYASRGNFIVLIDSDSVIEKQAIEEFMKTFSGNPKIGGVVGNCKVLNASKNTLTRCQSVWYDYAFNIHKTTESVFGTVLCCSGSLSGYRRKAIERFIPYWVDARVTSGDDRELTTYAMATPWVKKEMTPISQKLMESMARYDDSEDRGLTSQSLIEWETVYIPTAVVHTEVPERIRKYVRQQTRWKKGYLRSSFFLSAFFWRKNPLISLIFYVEFMAAFTAPLIIFTIYLYSPFVLKDFLLPITYIISHVITGIAAGIDYRARDKDAEFWTYKPLMNLMTSLMLSWLILPALITYNKNRWLTR